MKEQGNSLGFRMATVSCWFSVVVRSFFLNQWVKKSLASLAEEGISTLCITGMGKDSTGVVQLEGSTGEIITSRFIAFTDEMNVLLSAADLVVSRAGAGAIAEIVRCRVPAILVPYPFAADNHQLHMPVFSKKRGRSRLQR